ncbi:hypothetical protein F5Y15DRAFT_223401 [Xylariaceae sp. FL0016]|nr:hypothetical protein F5Y15DRAFT_223401 [Xylariaceae sp. FL0016]
MAPSVPRTTEVVPGALVNIVLKADQRTGRQVRGTVRDVLTRGDHHRGIKVRLADGRIGRVQSIASPSSVSANLSPPDSSAPAPVSEVEQDLQNSQGQGRAPKSYGQRSRYRDVRLDEPLDAAPEQIDLSAYIVPSKRKTKAQKSRKGDGVPKLGSGDEASQANVLADSTDIMTATVTCPVCGAFEGDEAAVTHHVAEHF